MKLIHYSDRPLGEIVAREQRAEPDMKPRGLWVSVEGDDDWLAWSTAEGFGLERLTHVHDVSLTPDANVLRLASAFEIDAFTREYACAPDGLSEYRYSSNIFCDWSRLAEKYDGLIIAPYVWSRRLDGAARWYYSWDCASGCIWNPRAISSVTLRGIVPIPKAA